MQILLKLDRYGSHVDPLFDHMSIERDPIFRGNRCAEDAVYADSLSTPYYGLRIGDIIVCFNNQTLLCNLGVCIRNGKFTKRGSLTEHSIVVTNLVNGLARAITVKLAVASFTASSHLLREPTAKLSFCVQRHLFNQNPKKRCDANILRNGRAFFLEF